ncbi:haloacid dehalogenase-like hydrolase [Sphingobacterium nematocida]|uniref:Haloacid dehalogenase-like hydrolase n=1 Tax=Sphingobacterium nematocida TaxID=1513896 RepID=A0A1T5GTD1_9SPHI|nr:HAD hydrolase family protein [Sphingobacterium nematocida]SKC11722.1 haloacid dehalogenase-like hydrolase [Sphingobacterium nematocida]
MAFGDGGNDIEMLKYVKYGVAMGNARQEVKDIAYHITGEVDEAGVVQALKYFNLLQEEDGLITL